MRLQKGPGIARPLRDSPNPGRRGFIRALRNAASALLALGLLVALAPTALADGATNGRVLVHADHVLPGEPAPVTGSELDQGPVVIRLEQTARIADVGTGIVGPDGTLASSFTVPPDYPHGYANLVVEGSQGATWSAIVLIGPRAEGPRGERPATSGLLDERSIALVALAIGVGVFVAAISIYIRRGRNESAER